MAEWGKKDFANNEPQYLKTNHPGNTNVFLVNAARLANATFGDGEAVAHQGWIKVNPGLGYITNVAVSNVDATLVYTNAFCTIAGSNTTPANASLFVIGTNNVSVVINSQGVGYSAVPTVTVAGSNNETLVLTVDGLGGRLGRIQSETMVTLSDPTVADVNSALPYFTGV